jgi:exopolysaccharide biosynthesis polyprenyl glycosylphosphotransferase
MFRRFSVNFAVLSIVLDGMIIAAALAFSNSFRPLLSTLSFAAAIYKSTIPLILYPIFMFTWITIFLLLSVYDERRNLFATDQFASLTIASVLAAVSLAGLLYITYRDVSRLLFLIFFLLAFIAMVTWRIIVRLLYQFSNDSMIQKRRVLIIGAGQIGRELQSRINERPYLGLNIVGFLDDNKRKMLKEMDILGSLEKARLIISNYEVDDVVIALPTRAHRKINLLVSTLHDLPVKVWVIPDYFLLALHKATIDELGGIPMLDLRAPALTDYQRLVKRFFDLTIAIFLLPISIILMVLIAIIIKLEDRGPILFKQKRVGENGRIFDMYKFRTMVCDAENLRYLVERINEDGKLIHKTAQDPRVTPIGKFLRKASLDELPQLINILKGEMSLVGPRPELPYLVEKYEPWQHKRFTVPQGVTGWWQVNGRSGKPMHLNTEDDLYYVQNYSLFLDLQILLKTVLVVLRGKGAF